jgi:signal transduction histidine kinase
MGTVAGRLFLSYLAVVLVGLVAATVAMSGILVRYENETIQLRLTELSAPLLTAMNQALRQGQQPREVIESLAEQAGSADSRLLILANNRRVLVDSDNAMANQVIPTPTSGNFGAFTDKEAQWLFVQSAFRPGAAGANPAIIVVARPRAAFADALRILFPALIAAAAVAAGFALIVAGLLSRTITRPLRELAGTATRFAKGDYRARVPVAGPTEVAEMGGAFNDMATEIERARGSEQAFLADISHELRTPLTSIQGFAQAIADGEASGAAILPAANIIQRESRRLMRMVEALLQVARLQSGAQDLAKERVDPAQLLATARAALEPQANEAGVRLVFEPSDLPTMRGDPDRLAQLFLNLIDNAVKHSPRGGAVVVQGSRSDGQLLVTIRDEGSGLPQGADKRLFRRFYRGDNAAHRDGAGLGLAIAQAIAEAHGGAISARNVDAGGAEFTVRLPVA